MQSSARWALAVSASGMVGLAHADRIPFADFASNSYGSVTVSTPFDSQTSLFGQSIGGTATAQVGGVYEGHPIDPSDLTYLNYSASASINSDTYGFGPSMSFSGATTGGQFAALASANFTATFSWNVTLTNTTNDAGLLVFATESNNLQPSDVTVRWNGQAIQMDPVAVDGGFIPHYYSLGNLAPGQSGDLSYVAVDTHSFASAYKGAPSRFSTPAFLDQIHLDDFALNAPVAQVPEPASGALMLAAMGSLVLVQRRTNRKRDRK